LYLFPDFRVSHFLPHLFREIFANTKLSIKFWIKFEYEKNFVSSFAKQENPEIISFRIALVSISAFGKFILNPNKNRLLNAKVGKGRMEVFKLIADFGHFPQIKPKLCQVLCYTKFTLNQVSQTQSVSRAT